ncbi:MULTISPECIES: hypothetical protein [unclassified Pseudonocardia]|uniref:hypothetical protein n=1 Tax=unclassified Pseudonocardia TaxID=2619320 RepID=UPI0001FFE2BA|nr:hypothetical protein [Pseudonocardia sp. Ae707_Ps1]
MDREDDGHRTVVLAAVDRSSGRYVGDPVEVAPGTVVRAAAALLRAGVMAVRS